MLLQGRLEGRLQESYQLYQNTITEMNEVTEALKKELCFDKENLQEKLLRPETKSRVPAGRQALSHLRGLRRVLLQRVN